MNAITEQLKSFLTPTQWNRLLEVCKFSDTYYTPIEHIDNDLFKTLAKFTEENNLDYPDFISIIVPDIRTLY